MICLWSEAGFSGLPLEGTCVSVLAATLRLWVASSIMFLTALRFRASGRTMILSAGSMQLFMWHGDQKAVSGCLSAILNEAKRLRTCTQIRPHKPCWLNGRSESLSLSLSLRAVPDPGKDQDEAALGLALLKVVPGRCQAACNPVTFPLKIFNQSRKPTRSSPGVGIHRRSLSQEHCCTASRYGQRGTSSGASCMLVLRGQSATGVCKSLSSCLCPGWINQPARRKLRKPLQAMSGSTDEMLEEVGRLRLISNSSCGDSSTNFDKRGTCSIGGA